MSAELHRALRDLIQRQQIASLATLHEGEPSVSMVPYALLAGGVFAVHVSRLAAHTEDMLAHPRVSLLIIGERADGVAPQARARVTVHAQAARCGPDDEGFDAARAAYLARFPDSEPMFSFGDFSLFVLAPLAVRHVGGFAQAASLSAGAFADLMSGRA